MADTKKETQKTENKKETKSKTIKASDYNKMELADLQLELQNTYMAVKMGAESDTSKVRKIKKEIARKLTISNS